MTTRHFLLGLLAATMLGTPAPAQTSGRRQPTLRERLVAGLQVRRPSEFAYIDAVIDTVNRGELPVTLVNRVFFWARAKAPSSRSTQRGIIYFQPGLNRLATRLRIDIEADPEPAPNAG